MRLNIRDVEEIVMYLILGGTAREVASTVSFWSLNVKRDFTSDGSACRLGASQLPLNDAVRCEDATCPEGFHCAFGLFAECCNTTIQREFDSAYSETCPDGSKAGGVKKEYFMATFGRSCDDMLCQPNQKCVQISNRFAKCCG
ncbi:unnamed protein product [Enterobius vermicularis]|uniref:EB domain-containing protein n=1 Tax=Enterobius vermicularis TaxID=51028 RepID=A0A0N4V3T7_ENTVE|nr:unnamed protein product [Enterobius vermicularis]